LILREEKGLEKRLASIEMKVFRRIAECTLSVHNRNERKFGIVESKTS